MDLTHLATATVAQGYPGKIFWGFGVRMPLTPIWSYWKGGGTHGGISPVSVSLNPASKFRSLNL